MKLIMSLSLVFLCFQTYGQNKKFKCFQAYSACMKAKKGMKVCSNERKECETGKAPVANSKPSPATCSRGYSSCLQKNKGNFKRCKAQRKDCLAGKTTSKSKAAAKKVAKTANTEKVPSTCYEIMGQKCMKRDAVCKPVGNYFKSMDDCNSCFNKFAKTVRRYEGTFMMNNRKLGKCKSVRKDYGKLKSCAKGLKGNDAKAAKKYLDARERVEKLLASAKDSGIHGCGSFKVTY